MRAAPTAQARYSVVAGPGAKPSGTSASRCFLCDTTTVAAASWMRRFQPVGLNLASHNAETPPRMAPSSRFLVFLRGRAPGRPSSQRRPFFSAPEGKHAPRPPRAVSRSACVLHAVLGGPPRQRGTHAHGCGLHCGLASEWATKVPRCRAVETIFFICAFSLSKPAAGKQSLRSISNCILHPCPAPSHPLHSNLHSNLHSRNITRISYSHQAVYPASPNHTAANPLMCRVALVQTHA